MKIFKKYSFHLLILGLVQFTFFAAACTQGSGISEDKAEQTVTSNKIEKPEVDLNTAVIMNDLDAVRQHIKAGSNLNKKEAMSSATPLMTAVTFDKQDIAKVLIDADADLHIKNNDGSTALHIAAFFGRIEMVQMLIDAKADKTLKNKFGATPRETVLGDFKDVEPVYNMMLQQLEPMGFALDMVELEEARPIVAMMLN